MTELEALGRAIKTVQWRHHRALDTRMRALGSTLPQWDTLRALDRLPGASGHELAEATFQSDQALGTLVQRLRKRGLVERTPGHGRRIEHHLTDAGRELLERGRTEARAVFADSFSDLSTAERAQLLALLGRVGG